MRKHLRTCLVVPAVVSLILVSGCAGVRSSSSTSGSGITPAEVAKQADGVATALSTLPVAPSASAQAQIANYAAWGAFLARAAAVIVGAI